MADYTGGLLGPLAALKDCRVARQEAYNDLMISVFYFKVEAQSVLHLLSGQY